MCLFLKGTKFSLYIFLIKKQTFLDALIKPIFLFVLNLFKEHKVPAFIFITYTYVIKNYTLQIYESTFMLKFVKTSLTSVGRCFNQLSNSYQS